MKTKLILLVFIISALTSCSNSFSKYEKSGKNDVEEHDLQGKVKKIDYLIDGRLIKSISFNKWGYYDEIRKYNDSKLEDTKSYEYNEYGNISKEVSIYNEGTEFTRIYEYDDKNNILKIWESKKKKDSPKEKSKLVVDMEYFFYDNGNKYVEIIRTPKSTMKGNFESKKYDIGGRIIKECIVNEEGLITSKRKYEYYADGNLYRTYFLYGNDEVSDYWEEIYDDNNKLVKRLHVFPNDLNNVSEQNFKYNSFGDEIEFYDGYEKRICEYDKYDDKGNWTKRTKKYLRKHPIDNSNIMETFIEERNIEYF